MASFQKTVHQQFQEITEQIKQLETMIAENKKKIKELHNRDQQLKGTIKQLKEKRTEIIFVDRHIKDR